MVSIQPSARQAVERTLPEKKIGTHYVYFIAERVTYYYYFFFYIFCDDYARPGQGLRRLCFTAEFPCSLLLQQII